MIHIELHSHTNYSPDGVIRISELGRWLKKKKIDKMAITDHNTIVGALEAQRLMPEQIIVGQEIDVTYQGVQVGELLAYYVQEQIPGGTDVFDTIDALREQGAFISFPHPKDTIRTRWTEAALAKITPLVDGVEVYNSRCVRNQFNQNALALANQYGKLRMVGSDAHSPQEIGRSYLQLNEFSNVETFKSSIAQSFEHCRRSSHWVHLISRKAALEYALNGKLGNDRT